MRNPGRFARSRRISIYTDASPISDCSNGGFELVIGPHEPALEGDELAKYVTRNGIKYEFSKVFTLRPGDKNAFEFRSVEHYRLNDRLIWTVQDLSDGFRISINNKTNIPGDIFMVKINHHREREILDRLEKLRKSTDTEVIADFNSEIIPYQGFEIMWDIGRVNSQHHADNKHSKCSPLSIA